VFLPICFYLLAQTDEKGTPETTATWIRNLVRLLPHYETIKYQRTVVLCQVRWTGIRYSIGRYQPSRCSDQAMVDAYEEI